MEANHILLAWLLLLLASVPAAAWWSLRLWRRTRALPLWLKVGSAIGGALGLYGVLMSISGLVKAFGAMGGSSSDPSQSARVLGAGVHPAMAAS